MAPASASNTPTLPISALSIGDLVALITYDPDINTTHWSLVFYAAEDILMEARYHPSRDTEEECAWHKWNTARDIGVWMDEPGARGRVLACRIPVIDYSRAVPIIENVAKKSSGGSGGYSGKMGRASISRALSSLADGEKPLIEIKNHLQLMQELDRLEQEFLEGRASGIFEIGSKAYRN